MLSAWVVFPLVMLGLCAGLGALLEQGVGRRMPVAVLLCSGLAVLIVAADVLTRTALHAQTPAILAVAAAAGLAAIAASALGLRRARPRRRDEGSSAPRPRPSGLLALGLAVFAIYATPIVASGEPTFAGYLSIDDTASWLAIGDGRIEEGPGVDRLRASSYDATLSYTLGRGYPAGAMLPGAAGARISGTDPLWAFQPYLAVLAVLLGLLAELLLRPAIPRGGARLAAAFVVAQPALLFAFAFWSGVKEMTAAVLLAGSVAALAAAPRPPTARSLIAPAMTALALLSALSLGGAVWLAPAAALLVRARPGRLRLALGLGAGAAVAALVALALGGGRFIPRGALNLVDGDVLGNLAGRLSPFQIAGVWPAGDFRFDPELPLLTAALIATAAALWLLGARAALRNPAALGPLAAWGGLAAAIALAIGLLASPWLAAKSLVIASPGFVALALCGAASLRFSRGRMLALAGAVALAGGVLASNVLAYREVRLAPYDRLAELEHVGERLAGRGPLLLTDFEPYATRHLLRAAAPEGPAELRRSPLRLRDGSFATAADGPIDLSRLRAGGLDRYPLIVQRVSPLLDPPPAPWKPLSSGRLGRFYEVYVAPPAKLLAGHEGNDRSARPKPGPRTNTPLLPALLDRGETARADIELPEPGRWEIWIEIGTATPLEIAVHPGAGVSISDEPAARTGVRTAAAGLPAAAVRRLAIEPSAAHHGQLVYADTLTLPAGPARIEIRNVASPTAPGGSIPAELGKVIAWPAS